MLSRQALSRARIETSSISMPISTSSCRTSPTCSSHLAWIVALASRGLSDSAPRATRPTPAVADRAVARHGGTRLRPACRPRVDSSSQPEEALRAHHAGPFAADQVVEALRVKRAPRDRRSCGCRIRRSQACRCRTFPAASGCLRGFIETEQAGAEHAVKRHLAELGQFDARMPVPGRAGSPSGAHT